MNDLNRHRITLLGFFLLFANQFVVIYTYLNAYLNGGKTTVYINLFGEQYADAFVILSVFLISSIALIFFYKQHQVILENQNRLLENTTQIPS